MLHITVSRKHMLGKHSVSLCFTYHHSSKKLIGHLCFKKIHTQLAFLNSKELPPFGMHMCRGSQFCVKPYLFYPTGGY